MRWGAWRGATRPISALPRRPRKPRDQQGAHCTQLGHRAGVTKVSRSWFNQVIFYLTVPFSVCCSSVCCLSIPLSACPLCLFCLDDITAFHAQPLSTESLSFRSNGRQKIQYLYWQRGRESYFVCRALQNSQFVFCVYCNPRIMFFSSFCSIRKDNKGNTLRLVKLRIIRIFVITWNIQSFMKWIYISPNPWCSAKTREAYSQQNVNNWFRD